MTVDKDVKIGVIRWDSYNPSSSFFGGYTTRALSPAEFHNRAPFFAHITKDGKVDFDEKHTRANFEREMEYAAGAGIDYFAYCWYSSNAVTDPKLFEGRPGCEKQLGDYIQELSRESRMHKESPLRNKVKMCVILNAFPLNECDYNELAEEMTCEHYQKIDGRPLVYIFRASDMKGEDKLIRDVRCAAQSKGLKNPYFVFMMDEGTDMSSDEADAVSRYSVLSTKGVHSFDTYSKKVSELNEESARYKCAVLPVLSLGWNPLPRVKNNVCWADYPEEQYADEFAEGELEEQARSIKELLAKKDIDTGAGHVLVFAWNEFEEGGWCCPTIVTDGEGNAITDSDGRYLINTIHLDELRKAIDILKG